jgi:hypothetical protein
MHSFQATGTAPLELMIIGVAQDSNKTIDVIDAASVPARGGRN